MLKRKLEEICKQTDECLIDWDISYIYADLKMEYLKIIENKYLTAHVSGRKMTPKNVFIFRKLV